MNWLTRLSLRLGVRWVIRDALLLSLSWCLAFHGRHHYLSGHIHHDLENDWYGCRRCHLYHPKPRPRITQEH